MNPFRLVGTPRAALAPTPGAGRLSRVPGPGGGGGPVGEGAGRPRAATRSRGTYEFSFDFGFHWICTKYRLIRQIDSAKFAIWPQILWPKGTISTW